MLMWRAANRLFLLPLYYTNRFLPMQLKSGAILQGGRYRIVDSIGRGGFGITYLAEQVMAKRRVCIKEFFPKDYYKRDGDTGALTLSSDGFGEMMGKFKAKFVKEAKTIAHLDHPNIIHILDVFEENNTCYYVMDYIEGESLSDIVKRAGALSERDAVAYIKQVASALEHIHEQQIMHLDVKPGNIMVREEDNRAILIDFGLSKHYDATSGEATSTTPVGVSHGYAPMEQYKQGGVNRFSPETDIYSLGATLYYLVTGNVPPQAADIPEEGIVFPTDMSSNIRETIAKSMSYLRKDRPHTIKDFLALLDNDEPIVAVIVDEEEKTKIAPQTPAPKRESNEDKPKPKKHRWWLWCLLLLFIVVLCISLKDLFRGGDNAKEVAKEEKRVEMPAEKVVTTPIESDPDVLGEQVEDEEVVTMDDPVEEAVPTEAEDPVKVPETSAPYKVGDIYNENGKQGVVFEVWDNGRHGKIVSLDETETRWDSRVDLNDDYEFINGTKTGANSYSDGKANTDKVMQRGDSDQYPAFVWCRNKGADWYLPAINELKTIYNNQSAINSTLAKYGDKLDIDIFDYYWSSTEDEEDPEFCAWFVFMGSGFTTCDNKYYYYNVRAVSAF